MAKLYNHCLSEKERLLFCKPCRDMEISESLRKGEELAYLGFADGLGGIVATNAATGGDYIVKAGAVGCSAGGLASARAEQEAEQKAKERGLFHNNGV